MSFAQELVPTTRVLNDEALHNGIATNNSESHQAHAMFVCMGDVEIRRLVVTDDVVSHGKSSHRSRLFGSIYFTTANFVEDRQTLPTCINSSLAVIPLSSYIRMTSVRA